MTKEELAAKLNGREYRQEITKEEALEAKEGSLLVAFGYSDDGLEFHGAVNDDFSAYNGTTIALRGDGTVPSNKCEDSECPYFLAEVAACPNWIKAEWDKDGYSWVMTSNLPFAAFDIMEDGKKFCRGIVIDVKADGK